jgi:hypothetical protein
MSGSDDSAGIAAQKWGEAPDMANRVTTGTNHRVRWKLGRMLYFVQREPVRA